MPYFFCLRNDLYCVGWGVKLYSLTPATDHTSISKLRHDEKFHMTMSAWLHIVGPHTKSTCYVAAQYCGIRRRPVSLGQQSVNRWKCERASVTSMPNRNYASLLVTTSSQTAAHPGHTEMANRARKNTFTNIFST